MMHSLSSHPSIDPTAYAPLLGAIAKGESGGNYNAYFGNPASSEIRFTEMTISEVLEWQANYVKQGSPSSAVGKYQIVNTTLAELVDQLGVDRGELFNPAMQDRLAIALLERRGAREYIARKLTHRQFAASIAKEWAGLPRMTGENPRQSYYSGDGLNSSTVTIEEINRAIAAFDKAANAK